MYRLLLVDDEALIREGVSENVPWRELGYELAGTCENGREACEFLRENPVDVVVTDICMPFMDGMELSAVIQEKHPHIKVLILSGYDDFKYAKNAIKYGVEEYILKPVTSCEMRDILTRLKEKLDKEREEERERNNVYTAYRKGKLLLCSDALMHVITGSKSEEECSRELHEVGIELEDTHYLVAAVGLSIYIGNHELNEKRKKESALMAFIVFNLTQEIVKNYGAGEVCQGRDQRVFILFHTSNLEVFRDVVAKVCGELIEKVREIMGLDLNIGLGSCWKGLKNVYRSYEEAEQALSLQYIAGDNCVIHIADYQELKACQPQIERVSDNMIRHIREYEQEKLNADVRELHDIIKRCITDRKEVANILLDIRHKADKLQQTLNVAVWPGSREAEENMTKASYLSEAMSALSWYIREISEHLARAAGSGSRSYAYQAMEYIERNYADSSLSLQGVCSHLGVSTSRFSSIFKQTFGATFMDILIHIRMEKARELLAMTELKNYEIAEKVGFGDPHYFSIAFKKATGMTPKEYARERKG